MRIADLDNKDRFTKLLTLQYDEIIPFVRDIFDRRGRITRIFWWLNIALLFSLIVLGYWDVSSKQNNLGTILIFSVLGLTLGLIIVVPLHEWIHGVAYKLVGAPKVTYGGNWRKFYFYAVADKFVVPTKSFLFVALAPFLVISGLALVGYFNSGPNAQWFYLGTLLMHTTACSGDFAMISFYDLNREKEIYTVDDVENKVSYFYVKVKHTV